MLAVEFDWSSMALSGIDSDLFANATTDLFIHVKSHSENFAPTPALSLPFLSIPTASFLSFPFRGRRKTIPPHLLFLVIG